MLVLEAVIVQGLELDIVTSAEPENVDRQPPLLLLSTSSQLVIGQFVSSELSKKLSHVLKELDGTTVSPATAPGVKAKFTSVDELLSDKVLQYSNLIFQYLSVISYP